MGPGRLGKVATCQCARRCLPYCIRFELWLFNWILTNYFQRLGRIFTLMGHQKQQFTCTRVHLATSQNGRLSLIWRIFRPCSTNTIKFAFVPFICSSTDCLLLLPGPLALLAFYYWTVGLNNLSLHEYEHFELSFLHFTTNVLLS